MCTTRNLGKKSKKWVASVLGGLYGFMGGKSEQTINATTPAQHIQNTEPQDQNNNKDDGEDEKNKDTDMVTMDFMRNYYQATNSEA